ncbi:hypothetical protein BYT27DRAFT_7299594 [Phlegmacium glaucopus]|nr:hypothetical protein BYT27DRAFT_7299594 [Phlegmacium glaucopus]
MTDLKPDRQKELKNDVFILFPRVFCRAKFLSNFLASIYSYIWVRQPRQPAHRDIDGPSWPSD